MGKIIGIDLGTTNSCVSVLDGSSAKVLRTPKAVAQLPPLLLTPKKTKS